MRSAIQRALKQRRPFGTAEEEVFVGLQILADRVMAPWAQCLRQQAELTPVQYNVLRILRGAGDEGLLAGAVGSRLITRSPDVTRLLDRLEDRGLVSRCTDAEDRRAVRVRITRQGLDLLGPLDDTAEHSLRAAFAGLPEQRLEALRSELNELLAHLDRHG